LNKLFNHVQKKQKSNLASSSFFRRFDIITIYNKEEQQYRYRALHKVFTGSFIMVRVHSKCTPPLTFSVLTSSHRFVHHSLYLSTTLAFLPISFLHLRRSRSLFFFFLFFFSRGTVSGVSSDDDADRSPSLLLLQLLRDVVVDDEEDGGGSPAVIVFSPAGNNKAAGRSSCC
jgi:hypothetical protein